MGNLISGRRNIDQPIQQMLSCLVVLHVFIKKVLLDIIHNKQNDISYKGLPEDPNEFYDILNSERDRLKDQLSQQDLEYILNSLTNQSESKDISTKIYSSKWDILILIELFQNWNKQSSHLDQLFNEIKIILTSTFFSLNMHKIKNIIGALNSYNYNTKLTEDGIDIEELDTRLISVDFKESTIPYKTSLIQYLGLCQQSKDIDENIKEIYRTSIEVIILYDQGK